MEGSTKDQCYNLWSYGLKLLRNNYSSNVIINTNRPTINVKPTFKRMYVAFNGCKNAFVEYCRPLWLFSKRYMLE